MNDKTVVVGEVTDKKAANSKALDSFANFASKVGVAPGMANQLSQSTYVPNMITKNRILLENAYRGSWVVGKIVDSVAEDMTKAGIDITSSEAAKEIEELQSGLQRLRIFQSFEKGIKWGRLYGGAIGVMMIDGQDLSSPLRVDRIQKGQFTGLSIYDRWQVTPDLTEVIRSGPDMGLPAYYTIITSQEIVSKLNNEEHDANKAMGGIRVHHSRVIRFIGVELPYFQAITEMMWGMSEIERVFDRLTSFDNATMSSANLINHANLRTVKVDGFREIVSSGGKALEGLVAMFEMMRIMQSNDGLTLLDKNDDFASTAYSFAGLSDILLQFGQQLSGASGIPLVRMFGQSPAGLSATGESDLKNYYGDINAVQESNMRPGMTKVVQVTFMSMFGRVAPSDMQFKFTALWQLSATEKATVGQTTATTITGVFESGLIKKSVALKELRQSSSETGLFTNITDECIAEAEKEDAGSEVPVPSDLDDKPEPKLETKTIDSKLKALANVFKFRSKKA